MPEPTFTEMRRISKANRFHADGNIKTCAIFGCGHNAPMMIDGQKLTLQLEHISQGVGHKSRMAMLAALMGGRALPAKELAYRAGVSSQTASSHLRVLEKTGFIKCIKCGRHRYYELTHPEIAEGLESLAVRLPPVPPVLPPHLCLARLCYDHLAGRLGVMIAQTLLRDGVIAMNDTGFDVSKTGADLERLFGIDVAALMTRRRKFAPRCIDWSERTPHIAGALGAAIASASESKGWIKIAPDSREVHITREGHDFFSQFIGKEWDAQRRGD